MLEKKHPSGLRSWTDIGSDKSWEDYGGKWARRARDGSYFILDFTNMVDACGRDCEDCPFVCEVKRVDLPNLGIEHLIRALECCGMRFLDGHIIGDQGDEIAVP